MRDRGINASGEGVRMLDQGKVVDIERRIVRGRGRGIAVGDDDFYRVDFLEGKEFFQLVCGQTAAPWTP
jgi:hypothetical protein